MYASPHEPPVGFEIFGHTADAGVKAFGRTKEEMFENAALGMLSLMCDPGSVEPRGEYRIELRADDPETLLVDWLSELIYLHETQGVLFSEFDVSLDDGALSATARGEAIDADRHKLKMNVKAVTYHLLEINEEDGYAKVLFDV